MMKAWIVISTLTFLVTNSYLPNFNSFSPTESEQLISATEGNESSNRTVIPFGRFYQHQETVPFGSKMGKVIKSKQIKEEAYELNTVVIDPGHGGYDSGCLGASTQEKHIALKISKKLAQNIQNSYPDVKVILTRSTDKFIPLHKRATIANSNKADLFISIHCNAMSNASYIKGSETYVLGLHRTKENLEVAKRENAVVLLEDDYKNNYDFDPTSDEGHILLSMVQNAFLEQSIQFAAKVEEKMEDRANRHSRGVKQAGFQVLRETTMPSVLVETGFLTNKVDEGFLLTTHGQTKIANSIFEAFRDYKIEVETGISVPPSSSPVAGVYKPQNEEKVTILKAPSKAGQPTIVKQTKAETFTAKSVAFEEPFPTSTNEVIESPIQFRVQLAASPRPINITKGKWKSINYTVEVIREDHMNKYQIPRFHSFNKANEVRKTIQAKGFKDAFIVAYRNGSRIDITKARKATSSR
jgi:N-acetylmuramoyl-L-alanine amidase